MNHTVRIAAIVAMARNRMIGKDNALPWHIPGDLQYFKRTTMGKPVILGRKTYESIGRPLPGRPNIIISRDPAKLNDPGIFPVGSIEAALDKARTMAADSGAEEIMIVGGAQIYKAAMPYTDRIYLTRIERDYDGDTWFDALGDDWQLVEDEPHDGDPPYRFQVWDRKKLV